MVTLSFWLLMVLMMTGSASVCLLLVRDLNLTIRELTSSCPSVVSIDKSVTRFDNRVIIILFPTAVETHCQKPNRGLPGIRPCDDRYLLRDNNQQQPHKISYAHDCCGSIRYNSRYQLCCRGQLRYKPPGHYCCGSSTYNPSSQLCCNGVVKTKTGSLNACCGNVPYDSSIKSCCSGNVVTRPSGGQPSICCG